MAGRVGLEFAFRAQVGGSAKRKRRPSDAFRVLLLGNFSGRTGQDRKTSELGPLVRVDAGDLDSVFARFEPRVALPGGRSLTPRTLDDLHPDQLFQALESFSEPRALRRALESGGDSELFARVRTWLGASAESRDDAPRAPEAGEAVASTLDRLLGRPPAEARIESATGQSAAAALIEQAVRPHVTPNLATERAPLLAALDLALAAELRRVLHSVEFRAFEALWRSTERLVRSLDTDEELEIWLLDASQAELGAAFAAAGADLDASRLHALLARDERPWTLLAADLEFGTNDADLTLLAQLAASAGRAGAILLADAAPELFGATLASATDPKTWAASSAPLAEAIRQSPLARRLGLAFPRVLVRRPYGKRRDPVSAFAFEELESNTLTEPADRNYGSAAFAVAELLGQRFRAEGWDGLGQIAPLELEDLPLDTFDDQGERRMVPCARVALGESAASALLERGVMPLVSRRDRASLRLPGQCSFSEPPGPLALSSASADED